MDIDARCEQMEDRFQDLVAGTLSDADLAELCAHLRTCAGCTALFDLHVELCEQRATQAPELDLPTEEEFAVARQAVIAQLAAADDPTLPISAQDSAARASNARQEPLRRPRSSNSRWGWAVAAAVAGVLFGAGWLAGRTNLHPGESLDVTPGTTADLLALTPDELVGRSEFEIDNVRLRDLDGDRVAVSFDAATYVETVLPRTDPLVREAVVRSLRGGADLGGRIAAIEQSHSFALSPAVEGALIEAMLSDPNVAVRIQAQQRLAQLEVDTAITAACLEVLANEESVQMRLLAIDMLSAQRVPPERLLEALADGKPEPGTALKTLAADYARRY